MPDQNQNPEHAAALAGNVAATIAAIPQVENLDALKSAEVAGKNRTGVLKAIEEEIAKRAAALAGGAGQEIKKAKDAVQAEVYVLEKNFGYMEGRVHEFIEAGKEFCAKEDAAIISKLHQLGAAITLKK